MEHWYKERVINTTLTTKIHRECCYNLAISIHTGSMKQSCTFPHSASAIVDIINTAKIQLNQNLLSVAVIDLELESGSLHIDTVA